jgi:NAD(P)-dependent dehydrogenase (short-subunit alcohol dehydrogenase family)
MKANTLQDKRCLVTGATGGLGSKIALSMDRAGCRVFPTGRNKTLIDALAERLTPVVIGHPPLGFAADLRKTAEVEALVASVRQAFGAIDILVNCAGVFPVRPFLETDNETLDACVQLHVNAPFLLSRAFAGDMVQSGWGRIINIASSSAYAGYRNTTAYCASKHALLGLSRALHDELKHSGVRVFCFSPGSIRTEMARASVDQDFSTFLDPAEIADFIVDVVSFDGPMIAEEIRISRMVMR